MGDDTLLVSSIHKAAKQLAQQVNVELREVVIWDCVDGILTVEIKLNKEVQIPHEYESAMMELISGCLTLDDRVDVHRVDIRFITHG